MPKRLFTDDQEQQIAQQYLTPLDDGTWLGAIELARIWGTNHRTIYSVLKRRGVETRSAKESHAHGKRCKPIKNLPPENHPPPLCKCDCGASVKWNRRRNQWNLYISGHYRKHASYKDAEWITTQYIDKQRTVKSIADECGVCESTVRRSMQKLNVPIRSQSESLRISGAVAGENNPSWNGGTTPERQKLYKTREWKRLVKAIWKRDGFRCQRCGHNSDLVTHHLRSWSDYPDLRSDPDNLVTLCQTCHSWVHSNQNTDQDFIEI